MSRAVRRTVYPFVLLVLLLASSASPALAQTRDIEVTASRTPAIVQPGSNVTFTITITNHGPDDAPNVDFGHTLPNSTMFVSLTVPAGWTTHDPGVGNWGYTEADGSLLAGESAVLTLVIQVHPAVTDGTVLHSNIGGGTFGDPDLNNNSVTVSTTVGTANVSVETIDAPAPVTPGIQLTYYITVHHAGAMPAENMVLSDTLPANTTFVSFTAPAGWTATTPAPGGTGTVTAEHPSFTEVWPAPQFTLVVMVDPGTTLGTTITNTATVTSDIIDPSPGNNSVTTMTSVEASTHFSNLNLIVDNIWDPVGAGDRMVQIVELQNLGPDPARHVRLTLPIPANTVLDGFDMPPYFWNVISPGVGNTGTITVIGPASWANNSTAQFGFYLRVHPSTPSGTIVSNTVTASSLTPDSDTSNNAVSHDTLVSHADLFVTNAAPAGVAPGGLLTFTYNVGHASGLAPGHAVTLTTSVPANTTFQSMTVPGNWGKTTPLVNGTGAVTATTGGFAPGAPGTMTLVVRVNPGVPLGTVITNTATVASDTTVDPSSANNTAVATSTAAVSADMSVTLNGAAPTVLPGANLTYTLGVANAGPDAAQDVTLTVPTPASTTFVSFTAPAGWNATTPAVGATGPITVTKSSVGVGEGPAAFTLVIQAAPGAAHGTAIAASATIDSTTADPDSSDDAASSSASTVDASTNLTVTMGGPGAVITGENLSYTIAVANAGPLGAQNVTLSDPIPANTTFVSATAPAGWSVTTPAVGGTGTITLTKAAVANAEQAAFAVVLKVNESTLAGAIITNTVTVAGATPDSQPANNTASVATIAHFPIRKLSIDDVTVVEGQTGVTQAVFTLTLDAASTVPVDVDYVTGDGTATSGGNDYTFRSGRVTIPASTTSVTVAVSVLGDTNFEANETFSLNVVYANAGVLDGQGIGTIVNDDEEPAPTPEPTHLTYYFAEGATGGFFDLEIALVNPNATPVEAELTFLTEDSAPLTTTRTLAATSRSTVRVDEILGLEAQNGISTIVRSPAATPLLVDRLMRWDANGYGGHGARAIAAPGTRWLFAEGVQNGSSPLTGGLPYFDTFILLSNANTDTATVTLRFLLEPSGVVTHTVDVGGNKRLTVYAGSIPEVVGRSFSLDVTSTLPILAERSTYFGGARLWDGGHGTPGAATPSTTWFHAEGATGTFFETYLTLGNPGTDTADVTLTYLLADDTEIVRTKQILAGGRLTINVEHEDPALANAAVSTLVTSTVPIVSERIMYWPDPVTSWGEAHSQFGVTSPAPRWGVAEGRVGLGQNYDTYLLLANPNGTQADVKATFFRVSGPPLVKTFTVPARRRFNLHVNSLVPELANETFGTQIEVTNLQPIVVEGSLYWNALGIHWAAGSAIPATKLP